MAAKNIKARTGRANTIVSVPRTVAVASHQRDRRRSAGHGTVDGMEEKASVTKEEASETR